MHVALQPTTAHRHATSWHWWRADTARRVCRARNRQASCNQAICHALCPRRFTPGEIVPWSSPSEFVFRGITRSPPRVPRFRPCFAKNWHIHPLSVGRGASIKSSAKARDICTSARFSLTSFKFRQNESDAPLLDAASPGRLCPPSFQHRLPRWPAQSDPSAPLLSSLPAFGLPLRAGRRR